MKIHFVNIEIEGFMSIGKATIDLTRDGITIVNGINKNPLDNAKSNGAGKSTIFEAIYYALTGTTIRGSKDIVNRNYPIGCYVKLTLVRGADVFTIIRSRNHQIYGTSVKLLVNEDDVSGKSMKDSSKLISEYLPELSSNIIGSILILGQGLPHKLTRYSPSGRKQLLEELSGTSQVLKELTDRLNSRKSYLRSEISNIDSKLSELNGKISTYNSIIESYSKDSTADINKVELSIVELDSQVNDLKVQFDEYKVARDEINNELSKLYSKRNLLDLEITKISTQVSMKISEFNKIGSGICPTCKRPFENANELIKKKEQLDAEIQQLNATIKPSETKLAELKTLITTYESELANTDTTINKLNKSINNTTAELQIQLNLLERLTTESTSVSKYASELESAVTESSELQKSKTELEGNQKSILYLDRALSKEFKTYMLGSVIEYLDKRAKHYASKFFTEGRMRIYADGNSIEIEVGNKSYESLSGGEAQKADLAIQFAMRDMLVSVTGLQCNMLVLDEVFDNLDELGCNSLLDVISTDLSCIDSVYVITHHSDISVPYDHQINVIKNELELSCVEQLDA